MFEFSYGKRQQIDIRYPTGQGLSDLFQQKKIIGARKDEFPPAVIFIQVLLLPGKEIGNSLDFVQNGAVGVGS